MMHRITELLLQVMYAARRAGARARNAAVSAHVYAWNRHVRGADKKRADAILARDAMELRAARLTSEARNAYENARRNVESHGGEFSQ